ncbi:MAG: formylglycine-generating enzyme family protein [Treponema sp.]|nr:formylglycine-generating enzyme family protein [Treponema sp.]
MKNIFKTHIASAHIVPLLSVVVFVMAIVFVSCGNDGDIIGSAIEEPSGLPVEMVWVPGGSFNMGEGFGSGGLHTTVSGFYIGKYPVTQAQYHAVMGTNPSEFATTKGKPSMKGETDRNRPVEKVSWYSAVEFCNKLSEMEGLPPYYTIDKTIGSDTNNIHPSDALKWLVTRNDSSVGYRLPTWAEWEYAATGGNGSPGQYVYAGSNDLEPVAWCRSNSSQQTHEVGLKAPNGLGIYDMSGNVSEWCWNWDVGGKYPNEVQVNPLGPVSGAFRVICGGSWYSNEIYLRSFGWSYCPPYIAMNDIGFRVVRR